MKTLDCTRRKLVGGSLAISLGMLFPTEVFSAHQTFVAGRVFARNGQPVFSALVVLENNNLRMQFLTGGDGSYFIGFVEPGNYRIRVERDNITIFSADIVLPTNERFNIHLN